jgi:malate synthase
MAASLFDAGLYLFWNGRERLARGTAPYLYLPKLQSHLEARLWNDVFTWAQPALGIPHGSIRATVLIETLPAAFEMEEILYELRDHSAGLNAGRWDYLFSSIKTFRRGQAAVLPDRSQVTMAVPFMRAYTERLVLTCHRRGAPAIGGMAAFIPSRRDAAVNATAMAKVREDKERESGDGFDGTWVAHPDLVPLATEVFDGVLGTRPNQHDARRAEAPLGRDVPGDPAALLDLDVPGGRVTEAGVRLNVSVALQYIDSWLRGTGAAAINNLMEDAATAEISRSQVWQWIHHGVKLAEGPTVTRELVAKVRDEELAKIKSTVGDEAYAQGRYDDAASLFDEVALADDFAEFLTLPGYARLD